MCGEYLGVREEGAAALVMGIEVRTASNATPLEYARRFSPWPESDTAGEPRAPHGSIGGGKAFFSRAHVRPLLIAAGFPARATVRLHVIDSAPENATGRDAPPTGWESTQVAGRPRTLAHPAPAAGDANGTVPTAVFRVKRTPGLPCS